MTGNARVSRSERVYRFLLRCYPRRFRARNGREMQDAFRDAVRHHRGFTGTVRLWARTAADLLSSALSAHLAELRSRRRPMHSPRRHPEREAMTRAMDDLHRDVRYAARTFRRQPGFAAVVTLTLALGIGANTMIFSLINEMLLRPLPVAEPERLVQLYTEGSSGNAFSQTSYPDFVSFRDETAAFDDLAAYNTPGPVNLSTGGVAEEMSTLLVSGNYFDLLGVQPALGRLILPGDDVTPGEHPVVVLGYHVWQGRFGGDSAAVGSTVTLNQQPYTVVGVAPPGFFGTELAPPPDLWLPLMMAGGVAPFFQQFPIFQEQGARWLSVIARLAPGATLQQASVGVNGVMAGLADAYPRSHRGTLTHPDDPRAITLLPANRAAIGGGYYDETVGRALLLALTVGLVLLIACANVANMWLARGRHRRREIAMRLALGAGRSRVVRQMLTEAGLLSLAGGAIGLVLAWWLGGLLMPLGFPVALSSNAAPTSLSVDGRVLGFTLSLSLITALFFGLAPALRTTRPRLGHSLKDGDASVERAGRWYGLRDALVVLQVAGSLVLLVGAGLFVRSLQAAYAVDLGFDPHGVLLASLNVSRQGMNDEQGQAFYRGVLEELRRMPGVEAASLAAFYPVQLGGMRTWVTIDGYQPAEGEDMELSVNLVTPGYFETLRIPLLRGTTFSAQHDARAPRVAVVNETFAQRYWPGLDPIGRRLSLSGPAGPWIEVIGVAATGRYRNIREDPLPYFYVPVAQQRFVPPLTLAVRTAGDPWVVLPQVRNIIRARDETMPLINVHTLRQHLGNHLEQDRITTILVGALGVLALAVASVGVYGVMSYTVSQRVQEIGIRTALGARRSDVLRLIVGKGFRLAAAGVLLGAAVALAAVRTIAGLLFGVRATDPITFAGAAVILAAVAIWASYVPARRATRVDPMQALRYE